MHSALAWALWLCRCVEEKGTQSQWEAFGTCRQEHIFPQPPYVSSDYIQQKDSGAIRVQGYIPLRYKIVTPILSLFGNAIEGSCIMEN